MNFFKKKYRYVIGIYVTNVNLYQKGIAP